MADNILKNMNLFVDGVGFAGEVEEMTPPVLTIIEEDVRTGGMDAPLALDFGMEKLSASFSMSNYNKDIMKRFGFTKGTRIPVVMRGALVDWDGTVKAAIITMTGKIRSIDLGSWTAGSRQTMKVEMSLDYYKHEVDKEVVHEIDILNMKRVVDGIDQLEAMRNAIGM